MLYGFVEGGRYFYNGNKPVARVESISEVEKGMNIKARIIDHGYFNALIHYRLELPMVEKLIFSGPATIILWHDGTKTVAKCRPDDEFDKYVGFCVCVCKKLFGGTDGIKKHMKWYAK